MLPATAATEDCPNCWDLSVKLESSTAMTLRFHLVRGTIAQCYLQQLLAGNFLFSSLQALTFSYFCCSSRTSLLDSSDQFSQLIRVSAQFSFTWHIFSERCWGADCCMTVFAPFVFSITPPGRVAWEFSNLRTPEQAW